MTNSSVTTVAATAASEAIVSTVAMVININTILRVPFKHLKAIMATNTTHVVPGLLAHLQRARSG